MTNKFTREKAMESHVSTTHSVYGSEKWLWGVYCSMVCSATALRIMYYGSGDCYEATIFAHMQ